VKKSPLTCSAVAGRKAAAVDPGTLGQVGWRERIAYRAQILELVLGHREPLAKLRQIDVPQFHFLTQARDQRILAGIVVSHVARVDDIAILSQVTCHRQTSTDLR
jgi:hypothetical protein